MASPNTIHKNQKEALDNVGPLLNTAVEAMAVTTKVQDDANMVMLLQKANERLWEARYWISEARAYFDEKIKREGIPSVKGN